MTMRRSILPVLLGILAGAACWFFGLDVVPAIVVGLVVAAVGVTIRLVVLPAEPPAPSGVALPPRIGEWPPIPPEGRDGARRETFELGWALRTPSGIVEDRVIERVRTIAVISLRRRHLDLDDPGDRTRIEALVGAPMYSLLSPDGARRTTFRTLQAVLGRLEALERTDPAARE